MTLKTARFVSRITRNTLALVLAGGRGSRLKMLTDWRAKPAVPFGGKFRIIDFALSNCINSSVRQVFVLTQYKSHSLIRHLSRGWTSNQAERGEFVELIPAQQWTDDDSWYMGTADAVFQSLDIVSSHHPEYVLILAGDHVYKMDYGEMLAAHVESGADFTVACIDAPLSDAKDFGVMTVDNDYRITEFNEKPDNPQAMPGNANAALVSMGVYVFSMKYLREHLSRDAIDKSSSHDFGKDIIPYAVKNGHHVLAYPFNSSSFSKGYWRDVGTLDSYYQSNLELTVEEPKLDIFDPEWRIWTYQQQLPPAKFKGRGTIGEVSNTMVSGGCVISASHIENSLLSSSVYVNSGSELYETVVCPDCEIGKNVRLKNVLLDNGCFVPDGTVIGEDPVADAERYYITEGGVTVVTRDMLGQEWEYSPAGSIKHTKANGDIADN